MKTISFELAKRLDELGVNQPSYFIWHKRRYLSDDELPELKVSSIERCVYIKDEQYLAYTLDEILEMLPREIPNPRAPGLRYVPSLIINGPRYEFYYTLENRFFNENPAEAAGELLAWCIEDGHIKPEDINEAT